VQALHRPAQQVIVDQRLAPHDFVDGLLQGLTADLF
jgi:hypothetical protein